MPFADPERLVGVLVESVQDGLVGGGCLGWIGFVSGRREFGDDLPWWPGRRGVLFRVDHASGLVRSAVRAADGDGREGALGRAGRSRTREVGLKPDSDWVMWQSVEFLRWRQQFGNEVPESSS